MATVIDSYSETNVDSFLTMGVGQSSLGLGVCFTANGYKITDTRFWFRKHSGPTGNIVAKIYTMTGTFGSNGNVGTLLATSDPVDSTTLGAAALVTFNFSGANQFTTTNGAHYVATAEFSGGNASNYIEIGYDSTGTHAGTWTYLSGATWNPTDGGVDFAFYVDGDPAAVDVTVNLTGVGASPAVGDGTVTIGAVVVEPPPVSPGGGTGARTGMRLRPTEDKAVYLKGVEANPEVGQVMVLHEMQRVYAKYSSPIPKVETPAEMPPGMRRLFKPVEKPIPPALFVYQVGLPKLKSAVGTGTVKAFYEDIDEETIAMIDLL